MKKYSVMLIFFTSSLLFFTCDDIGDLNKISGNTPVAMTITKPGEGDYYEIQKDCVIKWEKEKGNAIKIELCQDEKAIRTITEETENDGEFRWTVGDESEGNNYTIKCTIIDGPYNGKSAISGTFSITRWRDYSFDVQLDYTPYCPSVLLDKGDESIEDDVIYVLFYTSQSLWGPVFPIHLYKGINGEWEDLECPDEFQSFSYDMALDENRDPVLICGNPDIQNGTLTTHMGTYKTKECEWEYDAGEYEVEPNSEAGAFSLEYTAGYSLVVFYLTSIPTQEPVTPGLTAWYNRDYHGYARNWNEGEERWEYFLSGNEFCSSKTSDLISEPYLKTFDTSLVVDDTGKIYIAYSLDIADNVRTVCVSTLENNEWVRLGGVINDNNVYYFSLALGPDENPVIAYLDEITQKVEVKNWNGSTWTSIASFSTIANFPPSIIRDTDGYPILAFSGGIKKWTGSGTEWEDLGCPGLILEGNPIWCMDPSWSIASDENKWVIAYIDNNAEVRVKIRYK